MNSKGYILLLVLIAVLTFSCRKESKSSYEKSQLSSDTLRKTFFYSILLTSDFNKKAADSVVYNLKNKLEDTLIIKKQSDNKYAVFIGNFNDNYSAGKHAYELFEDSLISDYKIVKNDSVIFDLYSNIPFVANFENRPSVYNYSLLSNKYYLVWSKWGRKVINLNMTKNFELCFISTAMGMGWQGGFPYILDARIFIYRRLTGDIKEIDFLGQGLQLYTYWETPDTFKVNFTVLDSIHTNILIQKIIAFNDSGKKLYQIERKYNLLKDGFPYPPQIVPNLISPNSRYNLNYEQTNSKNTFYLYDVQLNLRYEIIKSKYNLFNSDWTENGNYLFIMLQDKRSRGNNNGIKRALEFIIYNVVEKKIVRYFKGYKYKNYLINGNLVLFDQRNEHESKIVVYNFVKDHLINEIKLKSGVGLNNILF
ncbi:hypothetical protein ABRY23_05555 [Melioribacteraceae bacterium 4301-Me]|uniref:hypothetical protein n=1 Tax=Pyranulibacter aquaticus TaxID=3163344 RepID=UPI003595743F